MRAYETGQLPKQDLILRFWVKVGLRVRHLDGKNNRKELKDSRTPEKVVQEDLEPEILVKMKLI